MMYISTLCKPSLLEAGLLQVWTVDDFSSTLELQQQMINPGIVRITLIVSGVGRWHIVPCDAIISKKCLCSDHTNTALKKIVLSNNALVMTNA